MTYHKIWTISFLIIWIVPFNLQALESCSEVDPNDIQRYYDPPPQGLDPKTLPLELRCASVNESIVFLPTPTATEAQRQVLETHGVGNTPAFQEGRIGISFQIAPAIIERPPLLLSFCLDIGKVCEPLLVWESANFPGGNQEQIGYTDFLTTQKVSRTGAKSIYADLLLPPDLVERLRPQLSSPQEYLVRISVADSTEPGALGVELASVAIVNVPEDEVNGRTRDGKRVTGDDLVGSITPVAGKFSDSLVAAEYQISFPNPIMVPHLSIGGQGGTDGTQKGMWVFFEKGLKFPAVDKSFSIAYIDLFLGLDKERNNAFSPAITFEFLEIDISSPINDALGAVVKTLVSAASKTKTSIPLPDIEKEFKKGVETGFWLPLDLGLVVIEYGGRFVIGVEGSIGFHSAAFEISEIGPFAKAGGYVEGAVGSHLLPKFADNMIKFKAELDLIKDKFALDVLIPVEDKPTSGIIKNIIDGPYGKLSITVKVPFLGEKSATLVEWDAGFRRMDILKMWPEHLAQTSAKDKWEGLSNIDAACSYTEDGEVFLFEGNGVGKYKDGQLVYGYPKIVAANFPGLWVTTVTEGIDDCVTIGDEMFFFKGYEVIRFDIGNGAADRLYPKPFAGFIAGVAATMGLGYFTEDLDAVAKTKDGDLYFFKGDQYTIYTKDLSRDINLGVIDNILDSLGSIFTQPKLISEGFPNLKWTDGVDGALNVGKKIYFFKGDKYIVYDPSTDEAEPEKLVTEGWTVDTSKLPASYKPYTPAAPPKCGKVYDVKIKSEPEKIYPVSWQASEGGNIPSHAFQAFLNADGVATYVCSKSAFIGQLDANNGCKVGANVHPQFNVLKGNGNLSWEFASEGKLVAGKVEGDICRARFGRNYHLGSVADTGCSIVPDGVNRQIIKHYEMLVNW
jgi:hypothetical protein